MRDSQGIQEDQRTPRLPSLARDLRRSIERGELVLHYQPKYDLRTNQIMGAEALVRWNHPRLGQLAPDLFIPQAEADGFILELGEWVLYQACAQAQAWQALVDVPFSIAVNLSPEQFHHQRVDALVARVLGRTGLDPRLLELEVTERLALRDTEMVTASLLGLLALQVRCSLDDFGTGYCGLSYLNRLPVTGLKIDKSFVAVIAEAGDEAPIVRAMITLAQDLHLDVVAEGVETMAQLDFLRANECPTVQGFLLSHPVPADELELLLVLEAGVASPSSVRSSV